MMTVVTVVMKKKVICDAKDNSTTLVDREPSTHRCFTDAFAAS